jgi:capsular exopolysaccharide synthesis family protein
MTDRRNTDGDGSRLGFDPRAALSASYDHHSEEPHLLDYVRVLYKRRWIAGTACLGILLATAVYVFTATPLYEGRVQLLIDPENPNVVNFQEVIEQDQARTDYYQTQYRLLEGRELARKTIDALDLWSVEEFAPQSGGGGWRDLFSLPWAGPDEDQAPADETIAQARTIDAFLEALDVAPVRNSRLVDVTFRSQDPRRAAEMANALAKVYIDQSLEFRLSSSKEANDWLSAQLSEQRAKVEQTEAALQKYLEQNDALSVDQRQDIVVQKLSDLNAAVTRAKTLRIEKETLFRQIQQLHANAEALDTFPAIQASPFIQQQKNELTNLQRELASLGQKLGDNHPEIIRIKSTIKVAEARLESEIQKVMASVRTDYETARAQENSLVAALEQQKSEALAMNRKGIEYAVLEREAESNRQIYNSLLQRSKETGVSAELKASNIRVVDAASTPINPVSPRKSLALALGLFGGLFVGVGLAFFFEYLDNRIKTPDEIKAHLGLPSLGMIPALGTELAGSGDPLINNGVPARFSEALRTVRTNVLFSSAAEGTQSIAVTSTGPGEGKTMVASNLAIGLAQAGLRVLLIDGDMRRPRVHGLFGVPQEPGLSNLMVGTVKASESLRKSAVEGLWVLPAGKIPPNPAELLASARFKDFLGSLSTHFDWVVVDTPPVMAVADAAVVGNRVSGVLFVVAADKTSRHGARVALDQLEQAHVRFVGGVLNGVDLERNPYYYARYYRKEYASYYLTTPTG